jgi:hypothetical protein
VAVDTSGVGRVVSRQVVAIERGPIANFARALKDRSRVYREARAAAEAGFDGIPAPPTFPFAMDFWGAHRELQEGLEPVEGNPVADVLAKLGPGLMLHGEQEFDYHRPIVAGDVLVGEGVMTDVYQRDTGDAVMTFIVTEATWRDRASGDPVVTTRFNLIHRARVS